MHLYKRVWLIIVFQLQTSHIIFPSNWLIDAQKRVCCCCDGLFDHDLYSRTSNVIVGSTNVVTHNRKNSNLMEKLSLLANHFNYISLTSHIYVQAWFNLINVINTFKWYEKKDLLLSWLSNKPHVFLSQSQIHNYSITKSIINQ